MLTHAPPQISSVPKQVGLFVVELFAVELFAVELFAVELFAVEPLVLFAGSSVAHAANINVSVNAANPSPRENENVRNEVM